MRLYLATLGTPLTGTTPAISNNEENITAHNNIANDFSYDCYETKTFSGYLETLPF